MLRTLVPLAAKIFRILADHQLGDEDGAGDERCTPSTSMRAAVGQGIVHAGLHSLLTAQLLPGLYGE